jgi:hypothetical protein
MRVANKGRNLRPRSSQVPDERASEPPVADSPPVTTPSADLRVRETLREPAARSSEPAARSSEPAAAESDEAPRSADFGPRSLPTKPVVPAPAAEAKKANEVAEVKKSPDIVRTEAKKPEPAKEEPKKAAVAASAPPKAEPKDEPRAAQVSKPSEPAKKAEEPAKKVEAKKADEPTKKPVDEPKKVEAKKADEPTKKPADEPKKVEAKKADEPAKKVEAKKADEPTKKPVDEPKKARVEDRGAPSKKGDVGARKPGSARGALHDDEIDPSSISAEFFRKDQDSVPPVEEHDEEIEAPAHVVLSPAALARRARLRRIVASVVAFAGVVSVAVVGKALATGKRQPPMPPPIEARHEVAPSATDAKPAAEAPKPAAEPQKVASADPSSVASADAPKVDAPKPDEAKKDDAKPDDVKKDDAKKDDAKPDDKKADAKPDEAKKDDAKPAASPAEGLALKKEALTLLNRGKRKEAIEKAKEAIAADGTDAETYLYLGSALQDSGKWKEGIEAYCECVRNATKGPVNECRAMGGHK